MTESHTSPEYRFSPIQRTGLFTAGLAEIVIGGLLAAKFGLNTDDIRQLVGPRNLPALTLGTSVVYCGFRTMELAEQRFEDSYVEQPTNKIQEKPTQPLEN